MNPRVSRSSRARLQGDRLPDREDRRPPRRRLRARGDRQRHHAAPRRPASSRRSTTSSSSGRASRSRSSPAPTPALTTHMKSVGEAMAIGRTFGQAFAKALRSRELDVARERRRVARGAARARRAARGRAAIDELLEALRRGATIEQLHERTRDRPLVPARASQRSQRIREAPFAASAQLPIRRHLRGRVRRAHALLLLRLGATGRRRERSPRGQAGRPGRAS